MVCRKEQDYKFMITPLFKADFDAIWSYFQTLALRDTLKYRFSDIDDPQWADVVEVIKRVGSTMYLILDENRQIIGEFMLENQTGKSMQIHFSSDPNISSKQRLAAGKFASQHTLTIKHPETGEYFLDSIYGLTPLKNRAACLYVLKVGFKKQGVLPSGMIYMGKPTDCMISTYVRDN